MNSPYLISRDQLVPAAPDAVFDLLARPAMHSVIDGSGTVREAQPDGPARLSPGARFGMDMKMGIPYNISNTVTEFEEGRRIAWRHSGGPVWRSLLEPVEGGTSSAAPADSSSDPSRRARPAKRARFADGPETALKTLRDT